ncbi:unnamed protein product [Cylicostephanus goldi]|uniref:Sin3 C-terminal domain-containing protein n=1 Tax=Cylicostephanus goldi TaxID=71465 RepID=A0A3P7MKG6_CYLGO|nr:unnamed protein product [Cylicostephanus goldi]
MSDGEENNDPLIGAGPPKKRRIGDGPDDEPPKLAPTAHYRLVYGGNSLFLFFRIHQMICDRLGKLKQKHHEQIKIYEEELKVAAKQAELYKIHGKGLGGHEQNASDTNNGLAIIKTPRRNPTTNYADLLSEIKNLLDGNIDSNTFEDNVRTEEEYARSAETFFNCQNCFKIFVIYEKKPVVTIELVDTETEEETQEEPAQASENVAPGASSDDESELHESTDEEHRRQNGSVEAMKPNGLSKRNRTDVNSGGPQSSTSISTAMKRSRLFLRRNVRMRNPEIAGEFVVFGSTTPTRCTYAWEGMVRRNRRRGLSHMERMHYIRKCRAGEMFADEHGATWLAKGMQKTQSHHPIYKFLQFNRYLLKNTSRQTRVGLQRAS